ncbi:DNA-binding protein [Streptomyces sp. NPDC092369]|uniref:DNA-binding protein n=1 Tax=Streptomyces sp. NPDC092369 TaxID=3366015 RepID=UPI00381734F6
MAAKRPAPTLEEIRTWGATVDVTTAAPALGISRSQLYALIGKGQSPVGILRVGERHRVVTASLVRVLEGAQT